MNHRVWLTILAAFLSAAASAQTSHFDVAGSVSYGGSQVPGASGTSTTQVNGYGWQASGISHFNRWLSLTSEFNNSSASVNSISLIGYAAPGTVKHYSVLAGPRIYLPFSSRFSPFVEGLAGYDRADTSLTSNGTVVTGNETQIAYAFGGGAQFGLTRRVGLNFEASYFGSEHTLAFTGWEPSHIQVSAGIVIRLFGPRSQPQIAKERPLPPPSAPAGTTAESATVTVSSEPTQPTTVLEASVQPAPVVQTRVARTEAPIMTAEVVAQPIEQVKPIPTPQPAIAATAPTPAPAPKPEPVVTVAAISTPPPTQTPATQSTPQPVPTPTQRVAAAQPRPAPQVAQSQPETSQPISLGEYARRLREKKQQQQSSSIHVEN